MVSPPSLPRFSSTAYTRIRECLIDWNTRELTSVLVSGATTSAVQHRVTRLKERVAKPGAGAGAGNGGGSATTTPKKRGRKPSKGKDEDESPTKKAKGGVRAQGGYDDGFEGDVV